MSASNRDGAGGIGSPRSTTAFALVLFLVANLAILGYAVHVTAPRAENAVERIADPPPGAAAPAPGLSIPRITTQIDLPSLERVAADWTRHCAACHGPEGRGDGPAAEQLYPKPRDFRDSPLRFASTGGGKYQVISAIERTISVGVPRSAMPGFRGVLSESEIAGLARHVHDLRGGSEPDQDVTLDLGLRPPLTPELTGRGRQLYQSLACATCHGESGRGDGPNARGLLDQLGKPVVPADFSSGLFKSGQDAESIARTILKGVPGTPMTPYEAALIRTDAAGGRDATDVWSLVYFIQDFAAQNGEAGEASGARLIAHRAADGAMLEDPEAIAWLGVEGRTLTLRPLWQRTETTHALTVRAARGEDAVAFCLEWKDETIDLARDVARWPDAVAVMLAPGGEVPALPMGVSLPGLVSKAPVNVWHWSADRQVDALAGGSSAGFAFAPPPPGATYVFASGSASLPEPLVPAAGMNWDGFADDPSFRAARAAGNPLARPEGVARPALEANAVGFGTLAPQPPGDQDLAASAVWANGTWRVVMKRPLVSRGADDVALGPGVDVPLAFAVWDGSKGDRAGVKQITGWHWLVFEGTGDER